MVSPYKQYETTFPTSTYTEEDIRGYVRTNLGTLSQPEHHLGLWSNPDDGLTYVDISVVKSRRAEAIRSAQENDQLAIYDLGRGETISVPPRVGANGQSQRGRDSGFHNGLPRRGEVTGEEQAAVTQALANGVSRANYRAPDDARHIFLGNPERSALERGLNSFLLYWPISYQLKVGAAMFKFLSGKAFNLPTGSAPAVVWNKLYTDVQVHIAAGDETGKWFTDHKQALFLLQQMLPTTPDSFGATLSPFTRLAGALVGRRQDPNVKKLYQRVTSQGPTYDATLFERVATELMKNLRGEN